MSLPVSLLLTNGSAAAVVARLQLPVPVVFAISGDPVVAGVTDSLARPSRNMTGLTFMSVEANGKRIEILRDIVPALRRVAVIENPEHPGEEQERNYAVGVGRQLGIEVAIHPTRRQAELDAALVALSAEVPQAICIFPDGFTLQNRERIADFALQQKLPLIAGWSVFTQAGALCSYGPRLEASYRRLAHYVDRILKGAKPADLPIERSSVLELVLNQRTARTIGVSFPPGLVALADEVIE
jgi:putative ABC transport system substrate-binding protein